MKDKDVLVKKNSEDAIKENKMGTMPIGKLMFNMSWPAILSMTISALYNIVDSIFVANISEDALTAVSLVGPIQMLIIALAVGSGVGVNSLIARKLGAKDQAAADQAASTGIRIGLINYLVFLIVGLFLTDAFVSNYETEGTYIYNAACSYLSIVTIGSIFINIQIISEKILQSTGNMIAPMACGLTGCITNIILDPILIFGYFGLPKLGVAGAAYATVIGQLLGMIVGTTIIFKGKHLVRIKLRGFKLDWNIVKDIYKVGFPSIIMQSIGSFMIIMYNGILMTIAHSATAVAVLGAYFKIQSFVFMPVFGLNQGAMPIMGYNFGSKNKKRLMDTYKTGLKAAIGFMLVGLIVFQLLPELILKMFDASPDMISIGVPALRIISICFLPAAFGIMTTTLFQATGHGMLSLYGSLIRQLVGILPLAYILLLVGGITLSWASFPLAEILGLSYSAIMLNWVYKKEIKNL